MSPSFPLVGGIPSRLPSEMGRGILGEGFNGRGERGGGTNHGAPLGVFPKLSSSSRGFFFLNPAKGGRSGARLCGVGALICGEPLARKDEGFAWSWGAGPALLFQVDNGSVALVWNASRVDRVGVLARGVQTGLVMPVLPVRPQPYLRPSLRLFIPPPLARTPFQYVAPEQNLVP